MKLLAATRRTQGLNPGDFDFCVPGELVVPPVSVCLLDAVAEDPDTGGCGCGRAFIGLASQKVTTTAAIRKFDVDPDGYAAAILDARTGWDLDLAEAVAARLLEFTERRPAGTVVRFRIGELYVVGNGTIQHPNVRWTLKRPA